jgi:hypothetical protein
MDALKRRLIVISWLAANGDELFSARAHVPLIIERDAARKVALSRSLADVPPQNRVNLLGRRCSRRRKWVFPRIEPPRNRSRGTMAFPRVMSALDGDVAMTDECFENLPLLARKKLAKAIAHPADRILGVPVLGWVEQIAESLPGEIGSQGHVLLSLTCVLPDRRRLTGPENGTVRLAA